ncbi:MAG: hypothetical protein ACYS47_21285, partial [Planctomycetota bacterium]
MDRSQILGKTPLLLLLGCLLLLLGAQNAEARQFRTRAGSNLAWHPWNNVTRWEYWEPAWWAWRPATALPGSGDEVIIQCNMDIPAGQSFTVQTLRVGSNDCSNTGGWGPSWVFFPSSRHQ